tara:strand:+ start:1275 stop:2336 length:1062 start_codon:yes stop_codon:yes gene_type:complete
MKTILNKEFAIYFGPKGYKKLNELIINYSKIFILVDGNTNLRCFNVFKKNINNEKKIFKILIDTGEGFKNLETCKKIWDFLSTNGCDRNSLLLNLGGGVVTDIGGFVASTIKRGIDFINVPTTLLSMVDASLGGKTGVNFNGLKNQIGIFKHPIFILIDLNFLDTLPNLEIRNGFSEMIKHGLIYNVNHWNELFKINIPNIDNIKDHIFSSILIKNSIVLEDPYEKSIRKILNFGHTIGHAIESYFLLNKKTKTLSHGHSIAIGMIIESYISNKILNFNLDEINKIKIIFSSVFSKVIFTKKDINEIIDLLNHDKKNFDGRINFVLLKKIGTPKVDIQVPSNIIKKGFDFYLS